MSEARFFLKISPLLVLLLQLAAGCATHKQSWAEWMIVPSAAREPGLPGVPEPSAYATNFPFRPDYEKGQGAVPGPGFDVRARNPGFPSTYIATVHVDLTAPSNTVHLVWAGPGAADGPTGSWRSSAGRGQPCFDCNEVEDSNTVDSWCTPKGVFLVAGFDDRLRAVPECRYVTWVIHQPRFIAIHSHHEIPPASVSHGGIRGPLELAKLIHNNSIAGVTRIHIYGKWTRPVGLLNKAVSDSRIARGPRI